MNKIIICFFLACTAMICAACEKQADVTDTDKLTTTNNSTSESSKAEFISEVSKENFIEIPKTAMDSFNYISAAAKVIYDDVSGKWMYGYKGVQEINGNACHVFTVYTENDVESTKVGTIAKAQDSDKLYLFDDVSGTYSKASFAEKKDDSWANTPTVALVKN